MIVLGIDPGIGRMGWGVVEMKNGECKMQNFGCLETQAKQATEHRLQKIYDFLTDLIREEKPDVMVVEELFFAANSKTALVVGEARGVILLTGSKSKVPIFTYTPLQVKQALTGYGRAEKTQIQAMVKSILGLKELPKQDDAADALAIAITHGFSHKMKMQM